MELMGDYTVLEMIAIIGTCGGGGGLLMGVMAWLLNR